MSYWKTMTDDGETVTLRRFDGVHMLRACDGPTFAGVVLDVETTGLDHRADVVTEIAVLPFVASVKTGALLAVGPEYAALQDPGRPLTPEIVKLTGLTDEMLHGQDIDWAAVSSMVGAADVVIAHNAAFDRGFVDPMIGSPRKVWACTKELLDWNAYPSARQELLCAFHGFFYAGHRALHDADALLHLLSHGYMRPLMDAAKRPSWVVRASGAPFSTKDALKARGYRWAAGERVWWTSTTDADAETAWIATVYRGRPDVREVSPWQRFAAGQVPA